MFTLLNSALARIYSNFSLVFKGCACAQIVHSLHTSLNIFLGICEKTLYISHKADYGRNELIYEGVAPLISLQLPGLYERLFCDVPYHP
jgi:hypothetical protein